MVGEGAALQMTPVMRGRVIVMGLVMGG